jgi:hypothetical protein
MCVDAAGIAGETTFRPLFRSTLGMTKRPTDQPLTTTETSRMVKRRLKDGGLPSRQSPHSFGVTAITSLPEQGGADGGRAVPHGLGNSALNHGCLTGSRRNGNCLG